MKWPLKSKPVANRKTPFFNLLYLSAAGQGGPDSSIVWSSELEWQPIQDHISKFNQTNSRLVSSIHLLAQAVGHALAQHPEINRRVVGRRVYEFENCNVCIAMRVPRNQEINVVQIKQADQKSLHQIGHTVWEKQMEFMHNSSGESRDFKRIRRMPTRLVRMAIRTISFLDSCFRLPVFGRIDRLRESVVLINDFSNSRFPVMRGYKPSRQPGESKPLSVTLGRPEEKVELVDGKPVAKLVAPITVRVDHRICDGFQLANFTGTIIDLLRAPQSMDAGSSGEETGTAKTNEPIKLYRKSA